MAPHHRRRIGASRRTVDDEGEEDGFPGTVDDDSLSEGSVSSQSHDEDDGCSEITETEGGERSLLDGGRLPLRSKKSSSTSTGTPRGQGGGGTGGGRRAEGSGDGEGGERNSLFNARTSESDNMANGSTETAPEPVQQLGDLMTFDDEEEETAATTTASRPSSGGQREPLTERKRRAVSYTHLTLPTSDLV